MHAPTATTMPTDDAYEVSDAEPPVAPTRATAPGTLHRSRRAPWIAAALSGLPGLGQVYNGSYARGVAFFFTAFGLMVLTDRPGGDIFGMAVAFAWLFNVIDAYREARMIQDGMVEDLGAQRRARAVSAAEGIGLGLVLILLGLIAFLEATLGLEVDWIFELWPLGMMAAGAAFLWSALRRTRAERAAALRDRQLGESAAPPVPESRPVAPDPGAGPQGF